MRHSGRLLWLCQQPFFMHGCPHEKYVEPSALLLGCKTCQGPHFVDGLKKKVQPERARNAQLFCADCFLIVGTIEQQRYFCPFTLLWHFLSASSFFLPSFIFWQSREVQVQPGKQWPTQGLELFWQHLWPNKAVSQWVIWNCISKVSNGKVDVDSKSQEDMSWFKKETDEKNVFSLFAFTQLAIEA